MGIQINGTTDTISAVDGNLDINQNATFGGNVTIGGTLTYEDVNNIDALGIVTSRGGFRATTGGIHVQAGISTFEGVVKSTVSTGTAPLIVASTTTVTNLSADLLDGKDTSASGGNNVVLITDGSGHASIGSGTFTSGRINVAGNMQFTAANAQIELNNGGPRFWSPSANTLTVHTGGGFGSSTLERLRIDSSGRVLIGGGSSPAQVGDGNLIVYSSDRLHPAIKCAGQTNNYGNGHTLIGDNYQADESQVNLGVMYSSAALVLSTSVKVSGSASDTYLSSQDSFAAKPCALTMNHQGVISFLNTNTSATTTTDSAVSLTERFRIQSDGTFYGGSNSGTNRGSVIFGSSVTSGGVGDGHFVIEKSGCDGGRAIIKVRDTCWNSGATQDMMIFIRPNASNLNPMKMGSITSTGSNQTVLYQNHSDYRLKENVTAITDGIAKVKQLKPYRFNFIGSTDSTPISGFFAHEAFDSIPEAVTGIKDGTKNTYYNDSDTIPDGKSAGDVKGTEPDYQSMDYGRITPLLTAALKEAIAKIEVLESEVAALKSS